MNTHTKNIRFAQRLAHWPGLLASAVLALPSLALADHEITSSAVRLCAGESKSINFNLRRAGSLAEPVPIYLEGFAPTERRMVDLPHVDLVILGGLMQINAGADAGTDRYMLRYRLGEPDAHVTRHEFQFIVDAATECGVRQLREADTDLGKPRAKQPLGPNRNRANPPPIYRPAPKPAFKAPAAKPGARGVSRPPLGGSSLPGAQSRTRQAACPNPAAVSLVVDEASNASGQWAIRMRGVIRNTGQQAWVAAGGEAALVKIRFNGRVLATQRLTRLEPGAQRQITAVISAYDPGSDFNSEVVLEFVEQGLTRGGPRDCVAVDNVKRFGNDLLQRVTRGR